jgi:hypothetical protein
VHIADGREGYDTALEKAGSAQARVLVDLTASPEETLEVCRLGLWRFYVVGGVTFFVGVVTTITIADESVGTGLTISGAGLLLLLAGSLTFVRYLRQHPEPQEEQS